MDKKTRMKVTDQARSLMLRASFVHNLGLLNGKMGIAIFFYHYARYTKCKLYEQFAGELIDEMYEDMNRNVPLGFAHGLSGIAWGIAYLLKHQFVSADEDVLQDLDERIVQADISRMDDLSIEYGLAGIACYVLSRYTDDRECCHLPDDFVNNILERLKASADKNCMDIYSRIQDKYCTIAEEMDTLLCKFLPMDVKHINNLGLSNGIAGWALNKILNDHE